MPQMTMLKTLVLAISCALLVLTSCSSSPNGQVSFNEKTGKHAETWYVDHRDSYLKNPQDCERCHGADLQGGISHVSCASSAFAGMSCHVHPTGFATPNSHGTAAKSAPTTTSGFRSCQACHGNDFFGGFASRTCLNAAGCHGVGVMAPHSPKPWRGNPWIHTNTDLGNADVCAQCHTNRANTALVPIVPAVLGAPGCFNSTLCHANVSGCSSCHDSPPQTGTHFVHYNSAPTNTLTYGDTAITSTADAYRFGCGTCHPLDAAKHQNGIVDVELYSPNSPPGSIKRKNPSTASYSSGTNISTYTNHSGNSLSYSNGTCDNVYCHSGDAITSGPVGLPLVGSNGMPILDINGNLTYSAYTVTISRLYKTTPAWGVNSTGVNSTFVACTECHAFPLTTSSPTVDAGVGDSHQWIDGSGYGNLHAWNMGADPLSCRTCHYGTVTQANTWTRNPITGVTAYNPIPIAGKQLHVNGFRDVVFDTLDSVVYNGTANVFPMSGAPYSLNTATFDGSTKTCSNVSCHLFQTKVTWGTPYRWQNPIECNVCHHN
jgi:predicted CxxxxCH...CXXCH cytochrome family protein